MTQRLLLPRSQAVGLDGRPLAGAKLYTYATGTSTPKAVFTDAALTVPHANPVIADAAGRFPGMFLAVGDYRTVLEDAAGAVIATDDPVAGQAEPTIPPWTDVASAATTNLGFVNSENLRITGTTTITSFGTAPNGTKRTLRFAAALTLTHNASSLILPGGASIVTAAGDTAEAVSLGGGNWIVTYFQPAGGYGWQLCEAPRVVTSVAQVDFLLPVAFRRYRLTIQDGTVSSSGQNLLMRFSSDGGATFLTAATYQQIGNRTDGAAANAPFATNTATSIALSPALPGSTGNAWDATFDVNPGSGSLSARVRGSGIGVDSSPTWAHGYWGGAWIGTGARMNALRVFVASGNLSGTLILEGLR